MSSNTNSEGRIISALMSDSDFTHDTLRDLLQSLEPATLTKILESDRLSALLDSLRGGVLPEVELATLRKVAAEIEAAIELGTELSEDFESSQNTTTPTSTRDFVLNSRSIFPLTSESATLTEAMEPERPASLLNLLNSGISGVRLRTESANLMTGVLEIEAAIESAEEPPEEVVESDQNIAALTPVSDFVFNFRDDAILWGRHGNDVLLGFDPAAPTPEAPAPEEATVEDFKWNVLLGDFLDENILGSRRFFARPEETGVNGQDRFILGDWRTPYYLDDFTAGAQQAAIVADFQPELDTIQLHGSREDYILFRFPITFPPSEEGGESTTFRGKVLVYVGDDPATGEQDFDLIAFFPNIPPRSTDPSLIGGIRLPDFDLDDDAFVFVGNTPPPGPAEPQIRQLGTIGVELGTGISVDPFGNVYVTGVTTGTLGESNEGSYDFWVAKYDAHGNEKWTKQYGTTDPDIVWDIETFLTAQGDVNFYLTGSTIGIISDALGGSTENDGYQDIWLARFDSEGDPVLDDQGNPVFVTQNAQEFTRENFIAPLGSEIDNSLQIDVDAAGNLYQSGVTVEQVESAENTGLQDFAWVASFDPEGNQRWINDDSLDSAEGFGFDESYGVALANDGTTFAVGFTQLNIAGPDQLIGVYDAWISRFDENGEQLFIEQFGSDNYDFAWGVDTDSENNAYIVGATAGDFLGPDGNPVATNAGFYDIFLAKYSKEGNYEWAVQFGTEGDDAQYLGDIVVDAFDNIFITGFTNSDLGGPNQGGYDTWVASYDTDGNRNWITQFGSNGQDNPTSIDVDNLGAIYITGSTEGSLGAINEGASDAWIAKLDAHTGALQNFGGTDVVEPIDVLIDLTGIDSDVTINARVTREAAFDNLLKFYQTDALGTVAGLLPGDDGYEAAIADNLLEPHVFIDNGEIGTAELVLAGGTFYAPVLLIDGDAHNLGSIGDAARGHVRIQRDGDVWAFEDLTDDDFNDLVFAVNAIEPVVA